MVPATRVGRPCFLAGIKASMKYVMLPEVPLVSSHHKRIFLNKMPGELPASGPSLSGAITDVHMGCRISSLQMLDTIKRVLKLKLPFSPPLQSTFRTTGGRATACTSI